MVLEKLEGLKNVRRSSSLLRFGPMAEKAVSERRWLEIPFEVISEGKAMDGMDPDRRSKGKSLLWKGELLRVSLNERGLSRSSRRGFVGEMWLLESPFCAEKAFTDPQVAPCLPFQSSLSEAGSRDLEPVLPSRGGRDDEGIGSERSLAKTQGLDREIPTCVRSDR